NGAIVFVTGGHPFDPRTDADYATVAYRAATGKQLWASRYHGAGDGQDFPNAVAVSPDGATVYVTGYGYHEAHGAASDDATIAYDAATGRQLWASRYHGPRNGLSFARSVTVSPNGSAVYVTGGANAKTPGTAYTTVAYRAATGRQLWVARYQGPG